MESSAPPILRFGPFEVDRQSGELCRDGRKVRLQQKPFQLLEALLQHPLEVVSRNQLRERLWSPAVHVDFENNLNAAIRKLRAALGDSADQPQFIETVGRRGYRLLVPVTAKGAPTTLQRPDGGGHRRLIAVLLSVGLLFAKDSGRQVTPAPQSEKPSIQSIAVLPLVNLSGSAEQEYFADGMTDQLITTLGKSPGLLVISRQSSMQYKRSTMRVADIAAQLNVAAIVEGTILHDGDRVRITAQLIEAATDRHLWSESYEGRVSDVLSLQDQVARDIATGVGARLEKSQAANRQNSEAYLLYRSTFSVSLTG